MRWNATEHRIEIALRSLGAQRVAVRDAELSLELGDGELIRTEVCTKYTRDGEEAMLAEVDITPVEWFTDSAERFGLLLAG